MSEPLRKAIETVETLTGDFRTFHKEWETFKRDPGQTFKAFQDIGVKMVEAENEIKKLREQNEALRAANDNNSLAIQKLARGGFGGAAAKELLGGSMKEYVETPEEKAAFNYWLRKGEKGMQPAQFDALAGMAKKALATDLDPSGGYLVMPTMEGAILHRQLQITPIRQYARVSTIGGDTLWINRRSTQRFVVQDVPQRRAIPQPGVDAPSKMYERLALMVYESITEPGVTATMLEDSMFDVEAEIASDAQLDFAVREGQWFVNGTGADEPKGYVTEADINGGEVISVPSKFANDLSMDSLISCFYSLPSPYAINAVAAFSRLTAGYLMTLKDAVGQYYWQPSTRDGAPSLLAGYRWFEAFAMQGPVGFGPGSFATGSIPVAFADWNIAYRIVDRRGIRIVRDMTTAYPVVVFKMSKRVGGQVVMGEAMRLLRIGVS